MRPLVTGSSRRRLWWSRAPTHRKRADRLNNAATRQFFRYTTRPGYQSHRNFLQTGRACSPHTARNMFAIAVFAAALRVLPGQEPTRLSVPPESPRWELQGQASVGNYRGRSCLSISGGGASVKDFEFHDGIVDVDVITP